MEQNKSSKMRFIVIGTLVAVAVIVAFVFLNSKEEAEPTKIEQIDVANLQWGRKMPLYKL